MAKPQLSWSQRLASCSLFISILQTMALIVNGRNISQSAVELASCDELQCANDNVCHTTLTNGTQVGHARCLCRDQWAGLRCHANIQVHIHIVSTETVTLRVRGFGPPDWNTELSLEELLIQEYSITFWNLNRTEDCNVIFSSRPRNYFRIAGLDKGQTFLFCVANGPVDSCTFRYLDENDTILSNKPNCVKVQTKVKEDIPLDLGLVVVPIACFIFAILIIVFIYLNRQSLIVHLLLNYFCCRTCYCCRKHCLRRKLQHMRKQQQRQRNSSGNLLCHPDVPIDDSMNFNLSVASTSLGNRSSIVSESYPSAKSVDSDMTIPPAYPDDSSRLDTPTIDLFPSEEIETPYENVPMTQRRSSISRFQSFNPNPQNWEFTFRLERPMDAINNPIYFQHGNPVHYDTLTKTGYPFSPPNNSSHNFFIPETGISQGRSGSSVKRNTKSLSRSETFPITDISRPGSLPTYSHMVGSKRRRSSNGSRPNLKEFMFKPINGSIPDDVDNLSLHDRSSKSKSHYLNHPPMFDNYSTFPRRRHRPLSLSSTLPRARRKKQIVKNSPFEYPMSSKEMFSTPGDGENTQETKSDRLSLTSRVPELPETVLPSNHPDVKPDDVASSHSSNSKEENVPRKRVKTLIGHFERSLLFLKPSNSSSTSSSSRPSSVHWEDEIRDLTSPLAVERARQKKKRPRPWSLPPGLGVTEVPNRTNQRRNQKPIFDAHPSLHILPPFTTDEEEEDAVLKQEEEVRKRVADKNSKAKNKKSQIIDVLAVPNLKKAKESNNFISSFEDDARNLVTPFICKDSEDDHDEDDNDDDDCNCNEEKSNVTLQMLLPV